MPSIEIPPDCLHIPNLSENATDDEIREAWNFLNRSKEALSAEKGKQAQKAQLLYQEEESRKWKIFQKALGEIHRAELDEKAGEEKSREVGKELAAIKKGLGSEQHRLRALG
jgi:hypothetical protein